MKDSAHSSVSEQISQASAKKKISRRALLKGAVSAAAATAGAAIAAAQTMAFVRKCMMGLLWL